MTGHTRRAVLGLGIATLAVGAGCVSHPDEPSSGTTDPPENETASSSPAHLEHLSVNHAERLHRMDAEFAQRDVGAYYLGLLTTADHGASFPVDRLESEEAASFVTGTDFVRNAVVVLQDRQSSSHPDLELVDTARNGDWVTIEAQYPGSGATADITTDTLLVRVPVDELELRAASAVLHPQYGDPVRFSTLSGYDQESQFDAAGDLIFRNRDCADAQLWATVTFQGDLFFRDETDLPPGAARRVGGLFAYAGEWTVTVRRGENTIARSFSLTDGPPGDVLVDVAGDGTVSIAHHPDGVDPTDPSTCETNGYPYESSSPEENLDTPVDLWVLDKSESAHHLTVTIRDGDTEVFSEEFDTREGYDKAKVAGLLAKKTTYTVEVLIDDTSTVSETVTVREGVQKLVVRVTESGEVAISVE